ncbi:hypothetical protein EJ08DRAFT_651002 [Tothia fuscella]|uniref:Rhodopsin domain-containing protein n=1 Tax=Tothia fuscella TaxID=1048955 RepID=A0A9P4NN82_9PEZI|nr:hypothetical protein EJ08DRAFT_651002 [Tothia fuscella]
MLSLEKEAILWKVNSPRGESMRSFPAPNYADPARRGTALLIMNLLMTTVLVSVMALRIYTRIFIQKWFGSDDVLIIISTAITIALTTVILVAYRNRSLGLHIWDIRSSELSETLVMEFAGKMLFGIAATCIRASCLCFYHRLLRNTNNRLYKCSLWTAWVYVLGLELITFLLQVFGCRPIDQSGSYPIKEGSHCLDEGLTNTILAAFHCLADFIVTVWPIPIILKLQIPKKVRIFILALLNVGFTVTIAGCLRAYFIWSAKASYDRTWYAYPTWFVAGLELNLGILCACAPAIRPLIAKIYEPAVAVFNPRHSTYHPKPNDLGTVDKSSETRLDSPLDCAYGRTSEIRGGGSTTPVTLDEEFSDMRSRATITDILVRTTLRVEDSLHAYGTSRRPSLV